MRLLRGLGVALISVATALGLAAPAQAQGDVKAPGVPEGVYNVDIDGQATTEWEIFPLCVPVVGDLREPLLLPVGCKLKVTPKGQPGAEAAMVGGRWQFDYDTIDGKVCPDGSKAPQQTIYSFDPYTWVGTMKVIHGAVCGEQAAMVVVPLTMSFNRPLAIPVDQYPLICEPGGLRRCF
ncbi:hypothetical protein ABQF17_15135 [Mycolicibacterium elephantis]|uniref:Secreted protein n=1 Tax=Mycolicibacterium elephantis TaxID=81858 RepID=A0A1A0QXB7_9MYCO|nr:hypothetical protein [Mycolicibacterium elephantis]OBB26840.1 hypothetical protein A5762_08250 [Mycolicibacterium elephantis]OBE93363.1 hypothetical protein A5776_06920 [Mycolicibacterium elephantis]ORA61092.1 hypothetical protein BST23_22240 [Mycolicibacterium elephantis]